MASSALDTKPVVNLSKTPPEPLRHLVCPCQVPQPDGRAHCGVRVKAGDAEIRSKFKAMDICMLCEDHMQMHTPCKFCGTPAR